MELLQHLKQRGWLRLLLLTREQPALLKPVFTISSARTWKKCDASNWSNRPVQPCPSGAESGLSPPPAPSAVSYTLPSTGAEPLELWSSTHPWSSGSPGVMPLSPSSQPALCSGRNATFELDHCMACKGVASSTAAQTLNSSSFCSSCSFHARSKDNCWRAKRKELNGIIVLLSQVKVVATKEKDETWMRV